MIKPAPFAIWLALLLTLMSGPTAQAQPGDPGYTAAAYLLREATRPSNDGSHNALLRGLRELEDPALLPLYNALSASPYVSLRVHGQLGVAELSPQRRIDLAALAEIDDQRELVQVLSAGIDDELIDQAGLTTLMTWDGLDLPLRQAIALRLFAKGGTVKTDAFKTSLDVELDESLGAGRLLQYALAALLLAESGDAAGTAALEKLATLQGDTADAVIAQTLDAGMRLGYRSAGPLGILMAKDAQRDASLGLFGIQSALRLEAKGAKQVWHTLYANAPSNPQRIRLAMIALDSAEHVEPGLFDALADAGQWIEQIADAGRAIAQERDNVAAAFAPLLAAGQPLSVQWVVTYCRRSEPAQGPALLERVILSHQSGEKRNRARLIQAGVDAATAWCELYPEHAIDRLPQLLAKTKGAKGANDAETLSLRQVILMGIARARGDALTPLAQAIDPDTHNDFTTRALRLIIRARHGAPLDEKDWQHIADIVQGVGQLDRAMRLQLAWAYLKHIGQEDRAIAEALR